MNAMIGLLTLCCLTLGAAPLPMLSPAPVIDGKPGDSGWEKALKVPYKKKQATAWIGRTATHLYVAVESKHGAINEKVSNCTGHDSDVYGDDCLDLFLNTSGKNDCYQIIANVNGAIFDHFKDELGRTTLTWDSGAKAAGCYGSDSFYIEMSVPLASIAPPDGKLALAIGSYTRWDLNAESVLGSYHQPKTFTIFDIPEGYPIQVISANWSRFAGRQPCRFEIKNTSDVPVQLTGELNKNPVHLNLGAGQTRLLECVAEQTAGKENTNTLILYAGKREVLRLNRILIPDEILKVVPLTDIIYEGESLPLQITVNEKQTEPLLIQYFPGKVLCNYKGETFEIPYKIISSPWRDQ